MTGRKNKVKELPALNSAWLGPPGLMRPHPPAWSLPTPCLPDGILPAILHSISVKCWLWTYRSKLPSLCHESNVADCQSVSHRKGINDSPEAHSSPPMCTRRLPHRAITPPLPSHSFQHQLHCLQPEHRPLLDMEFSYHWRLSIPSASHRYSALRLPLGPQERSNTAFTSRKHVSLQLLRSETSDPALPHLIPWLSFWKILFTLCPDCTCPTAVSLLSHPPPFSATTVASMLGFLPSLVLSCPL